MSDNQSTSIGVSGQSYKDFLLTTDVASKLDPKYGLQLALDIEQKYSAGVANGYAFMRNSRFKSNILWASGKVDIYSMFSDRLQLNAKINYANIKWAAPMIVNRIISGLIGRWKRRLEKIQVTAIDPLSVQAKKDQYEQAEFVLYNRKQLEELQKESGVPMIPEDQFVPEDKDDLEEWAISGQRLPEEIKYEMGVDGILRSAGFFDVLKDKLLHDSSECGLLATYVWMDEYGEIHPEYVKALNTMYSYSEYDDMRDTAMRGFVRSMKISEVRRKYGRQFGGKLSEEELFQLAQGSDEYQRYDKLTWNYDWMLAYVRPYDEWNIEVTYFWIKSVDQDSVVKTVTKQNKRTLLERRDSAPESLDENQEFIKKDKWNLYKGVFARNSRKILEWGLDNNLIRSQDPKESGDVEFPVSIYMYQNQDMRNIAIPEKIEEPVEQMILARLKIQQCVATMVPPGAMINMDALQEVDLGLAADGESPINVQKVYEQTGKLYYRGRDSEGNPIPVPIQELTNTGFINQVNALIQLYTYHYQVLKDELGEDPNLITQALQPRVTSDNVNASQQAGEYATDYVYNGYKYIMEETAKKVACLLNNSVRLGAQTYAHLMNKEEVKDRNFSTKYELLPDQYEINDLVNFMNQALAANPALINYIDPMKLKRIAKENVKLAELYFRNAMKRMIRSEKENMQKQNEMAAQAAAQAAQQKAASDDALLNKKLETDLKLAEFQALQDLKLESLKIAGQIIGKNESPEMPAWLTGIINQLFPNITIPIGQQNKNLIEGIQQQQMQEQQAQEEMAEQEQMEQDGGAPDEQMMQQQMQPQ